MSQALSYIEIDLPKCSRVYGTLPCGARLPSDNDPVMASFNGSGSVLKRGAGLTGASDGKQMLFNIWANVEEVPTALMVLLAGATSVNGTTVRVAVFIDTDGRLAFFAGNSAGSVILDQRSSVIPLGRPFHCLASFDLSSASARHIYIDDASALAVNTTFTNDTIDFTQADWSIGGTPGGTLLLTGSIGAIWFTPGAYLDLSTTSNRRKFIDANRDPVDLGADGSAPTGSAPLVFLNSDIDTWHTNDGAGGGFTLTGTIGEVDFATGGIKCFNSRRTCQDREALNEQDETVRFAVTAEYLPREIEALPLIAKSDDIAYTPAVISLGKDLGTRATLAVTFTDAPHSDTGVAFDDYLEDRDYEPYQQGTFFGKFSARWPFLRGAAMRWKIGRVGLTLADFETRHFKIEAPGILNRNGKFTINAKDVLKAASGDRAQAPALSAGYLAADITAVATSFTLLPTGIGSTYPAGGQLCLGGKEIIGYTRSGDTITVTGRGAFNTTAVAHKAQDRVQEVIWYYAQEVWAILQDLLVNYSGVDSSYLDTAVWLAETDTFLGNVYTAVITEPTDVDKLIGELIEQAGLALWDDNVAQKLRLQVLRAVSSDAALFTMDNSWGLDLKEQPEKRLSRVRIYFGQVDPTKPLSNLDNYRSSIEVADEVAEEDYGSPAYKVITSRWIPEGGRSIAQRLGEILLGRYRDPPKRVKFIAPRATDISVVLGAGYQIQHDCIQGATGAPASMPVQITSLKPTPSGFEAEGEEILWTAPAEDSGVHAVIYDASTFNVNARTSHDLLYGPPQAGDVVNITVLAGVVIGSHSTGIAAFIVGTWPSGVTVNITVLGRIQGCGALGGTGGGNPHGFPGGVALYCRSAANIDLTSAQVWGGGGGGAAVSPSLSAGGGGGAGTDPGPGGGGYLASGNPGTSTSGGLGGFSPSVGYAGSGGDPGQAGQSTAYGGGGAAGAGIDGISYLTVTGTGDVRGSQIN